MNSTSVQVPEPERHLFGTIVIYDSVSDRLGRHSYGGRYR